MTRPYQSLARAKAASDTRRNIPTIAMRLFLERGSDKVAIADIADIADIAEEGGLATPKVYASTTGNAAILATRSSTSPGCGGQKRVRR